MIFSDKFHGFVPNDFPLHSPFPIHQEIIFMFFQSPRLFLVLPLPTAVHFLSHSMSTEVVAFPLSKWESWPLSVSPQPVPYTMLNLLWVMLALIQWPL